MILVADDDMVEAFEANGSDHAFDIAVLTRGLRTDRMIADSVAADGAFEDVAVSLVVVAE